MTRDTRQNSGAATARWSFIVLAVVTCSLAGSVGAALGWLAARLHEVGTDIGQITERHLAGLYWGGGGSMAAALVWTAVMTALTRRAIRRTTARASVGRTAMVGATLGVLAGAAATAGLHAAMTFLVFRQDPEPAIWFLGMLVGVPTAGFGGLFCALPYGLIARRNQPPPAPDHVDMSV